jgi:Tfp pilus assembly protein PilX
MASSTPNKVLAARAAAILTTGEVAGTRLDLNEAFDSQVTVQLDFTKGSLTNGIFRAYVSIDGTTYYLLQTEGGTDCAYTYTADTARAIAFRCHGWKYFRVTVQGTGTVTSSSATVSYRYLRRGSQM